MGLRQNLHSLQLIYIRCERSFFIGSGYVWDMTVSFWSVLFRRKSDHTTIVTIGSKTHTCRSMTYFYKGQNQVGTSTSSNSSTRSRSLCISIFAFARFLRLGPFWKSSEIWPACHVAQFCSTPPFCVPRPWGTQGACTSHRPSQSTICTPKDSWVRCLSTGISWYHQRWRLRPPRAFFGGCLASWLATVVGRSAAS
jgi:hypothetical protein